MSQTQNENNEIPRGVVLAASWSWRIAAISVAILTGLFLLQKFMLLTLPIFVALLLASIGAPVVDRLVRWHFPRWLASTVVLIGGLAALGLLGYFVVQQVIANSDVLADQVVSGIEEIERWLVEGPIGLKEQQITDTLGQLQDFIQSKASTLAAGVTGTLGTISNLVAGMLITFFAFFFFLKDGSLIWRWTVSIFPKSARTSVDGAGRAAWGALAGYTKATVMVALVDSIGIMIIAQLLDIPMVLPIGVLVFLGSFIPMVGGLISGMIPVLIALVVHDPTTALLMLGGVILVQQIEGNLLQPLIMGKMVSIHPLAVLLSLTAGITLAGIPGALISVPFVACVNAAILHLNGHGVLPPDSQEELEEEIRNSEEEEPPAEDSTPTEESPQL